MTEPTRRDFFRHFAGDLLTTAAQVTSAVAELRDRSAAEAGAIFSDGTATIPGPPAGGSRAAPTGFRTPFRFETDDLLLVIDQRRLPDVLVEVPIRSAHDASAAIRDMTVRGAPAIGQVAAIGMALTARTARLAQPTVRRAILEGAANSLRNARPTAINLRWAVERLMARYRAIGLMSPDGEAIAEALEDEALTIVAEATEDHGRLAEAGLAVLPRPADRALEILTHCNTGPLACGQYGTALGIVQAAHHAELPIHVWVDETRPYLQGARLTAWELDQAGVAHTLLPDVAAGSLIASGRVDVILVGADRVAANGDVANKVGTYPLAVLAARHSVPFLVCAPLSSIDLATPDGASIPMEERSADEVTSLRGVRIAPAGTDAVNPAFDLTPAELIGGIVTDEGVLRAPYEASLQAAVERRAARRAAAGIVTLPGAAVAASSGAAG